MTDSSGWGGHPKGLSTLFFTEMWERFSYYGMRALLILYLAAAADQGGPGFDVATAAYIYGFYTFGVYATGIPGGWIADRFLGQYRSVLLGGVIIALGHFSMAFPSLYTFFGGLLLIVVGTGLLKTNVSALVGSLYDGDDARRDGGFSLFYMGINVGAFLAPFVVGTIGQKIGWHWGFGVAGVGMVAGIIQYVLGKDRLMLAAERLRADVRAVREQRRQTAVEGSAIRSGLSAQEWKRIGAIGVLFLFTTLFWAAFEQAGSSLNLFADRLTRLSVWDWEFPSTWFQSLNSLFIILLAPLFAWLWVRLGRREPSSPAKFTAGLLLVGSGFLLLVPASMMTGYSGGASSPNDLSPMWLVGVYLLHTLGELCLSPVGLSIVTKLAPRRIVGSMMGVWFLSIAIGNGLGGWVAGFFDTLPLPQLFGAVFVTTTVAALFLAFLIKPIRRLMGGVH